MYFNIYGRRLFRKSDLLLEINSVLINKKMLFYLVLLLFRGFVVYGFIYFNILGFGNDYY